MNVEIFIVSHAKDAPWLEYCLESIDRFARGFSRTTVLVPQSDVMTFAHMCGRLGAHLEQFPQAAPPLGHLDHNIQKCRADEWCPNADYICHIDSDCIFRERVTPEMYFEKGLPVLLIERYAKIEGEINHFPWRHVVERTLKRPVEWETMRRHPAVHYRDLYGFVRATVEHVQKVPFNNYVLAQKSDYPCGFAEFNTIGAVIMDSGWKNEYHLIDVGQNPYPPNPLVQFWSHGGLTQPQNIWIEGRQVSVVPEQEIKRILS